MQNKPNRFKKFLSRLFNPIRRIIKNIKRYFLIFVFAVALPLFSAGTAGAQEQEVLDSNTQTEQTQQNKDTAITKFMEYDEGLIFTEEQREALNDEFDRRGSEVEHVVFGRTFDYAAEAIFDTLNLKGNEIIGDIGSFRGEFCLTVAGLYPDAKVIGIEIMETLVKESEERKADAGIENVQFVNSNILDVDLSLFDILFMHIPITTEGEFYYKFSEKLAREIKPGAKFVTYGTYYLPRWILMDDYKEHFDFYMPWMPSKICPFPYRGCVNIYTKLPDANSQVGVIGDVKEPDKDSLVISWLEEERAKKAEAIRKEQRMHRLLLALFFIFIGSMALLIPRMLSIRRK